MATVGLNNTFCFEALTLSQTSNSETRAYIVAAVITPLCRERRQRARGEDQHYAKEYTDYSPRTRLFSHLIGLEPAANHKDNASARDDVIDQGNPSKYHFGVFPSVAEAQ